MKTYSNLTENQKMLFDKLNALFMNHTSITQKDFVMVLAILINRYKFKKKKVV